MRDIGDAPASLRSCAARNLVTLCVTPESRSAQPGDTLCHSGVALRATSVRKSFGAAKAALQDPEGPFQGPRGAPERRPWRLAASAALR